MRSILIFCFLWLSAHTTWASSLIDNPLTNSSLQFNLAQANQTFDHINLELSVQNLHVGTLNKAIKTLSQLTTQADQCVEDAKKKLTNLDALQQQSTNAMAQKIASADDLYLNAEQRKMAENQANCRLFSIRAKEAIDAYKTAVVQLSQQQTLAQGEPLWNIISQQLDAHLPAVDMHAMPTQMPEALQSPQAWFAMVICSLILSIFSLTQIRKIYFFRHYFHIKRVHVTHVLALSACIITGMVSLYLLIFFGDVDTHNLLLGIASRLFFYFAAWVLIIMLFKIKRIRAALQWYSLDMRVIRRALLLLISFYTLSTVGFIFIQALHLEHSIGPLCQSLFLLTMLASGIYFTYYFFHVHKKLPFVKHHGHYIKYLSILLFFSCGLLDILGFHALALRLTTSGFITVVIVFITILMIQGINKSYFILNHHAQTKSQLIKYFGYKDDQVFTEFLILKVIFQLIVIALSLYLIVRSWGFATYYLENVYTQLLYGIHIASTTIYPTRIALGIMVYCLMYLIFRSISTAISRHQQFEEEEETQVAIASILTYLGFSLALLSGLLVAGFNFTGLAIIAGALSVGIGLGLQSIVNNFVSGLILLIEKPIKPGDRINIDGIEGFVKKIRVRSTHIITPAYEDIIVPNSDLITRRVTNYVYSNKQCSINCDITIPHGSHTERVRELLLEAAHAHEEVIKTGRNKPHVLFRAFQEKGLAFQLCCLIKDVNKKLLVQSDLNFAIEHRLRELDHETWPAAH